jgi:hypothetical protein
MKRRLETPELALASLKRRFEKRLKVAANGCIEWTGSKTRGYGYVSFWSGEKGTSLRAHRVAYALANGLPPNFSDGVVMHTCDNPACVNAAHLTLGEQSDNMADKKAKGRNQFGSRCTYAKLDEDTVRAIRSDTRSQYVIAAELGLVQQTVSDIKRRRIWKHVA